ncbi:MAG: hypothetical protein H7Z19_06815 [Chitinophagaceae bacterium]|nr:hypothetical protein [Rubrivivax sp.]
MRSGRPTFKETQVYTWESEPVDDRPSEFATSALMSASPHRPLPRLKDRWTRILLLWIGAGSVLVLGVVRILDWAFA